MTKNTKTHDDALKANMAKNTQKVLDKFFIHQCMVRRFYKNNPDIFKKLIEFRGQLECMVEKNLGCSVPQAHVVYYIMNSMQNSKVQTFLKNGKLTECRNFLFDTLEPINFLMEVEVEELLDDETIDKIINLMSVEWPVINLLMSRTNMFRYFTLYASTVIIDFEHLMVMQRLAEQGDIPLYRINASLSPKLTKWIEVRFNPLAKNPANAFENRGLGKIYRDIYCLFECGGAVRKFNSRNVKVIDDRFCDVVVDGVKSDGRIYLSVPYTELPVDIDEAMRVFKNIATKSFIDNEIYRCNTEGADYWHSNFYKKNDGASMSNTRGDNNITLLKQKNSFLKLQLGLLVWDKVKIDGKTIESSLEEACNLIEKNNLFTRSESSLAKDYDNVASLINPESKSGIDPLSKVLSKMDDVVVK